MAGSRTWRRYISDMGRVYRYEVDKSAADGILSTTLVRMMLPSTVDRPLLPCGMTPRYFYAYDRATPSRKRKFVMGETQFLTESILDGNGYITTRDDSTSGGTVLWLITGYVGETYRNMPRYYFQVDTGLQDGDISQ
jgi:hypothetical protein